VAVSETAWAVVTAVAVAVNPAVVAFAATVTEAGTVTAVLALERVTVWPPLGAGPFSVTVHASVTEPTTVPLAHAIEPTPVSTPVPLITMTVALFVEELLLTVSFPVLSPEAGGTNVALIVAVWPGFSVSGMVGPVTTKLPE